MQTQIIAREALRELLKEGKELTPEAYAEAYYAAAKKLDIAVEREFSIEKVLEMLEPEVKENLPNKFKHKNEFFIALVKMINQLNFLKRNFKTSLETLKFLLRLLATHSQEEVRTLAKGHFIELDKLNAQSVQIWRKRWMEQVKKIPEFDALEAFKPLEVLSSFKIPNLEFQQWQDKVKELLKEQKPSKEAQMKLLKSLELQLLSLYAAKDAQKEKDDKQEEEQIQQEKQEEPLEDSRKLLEYEDAMVLPIDPVTTLVSKAGIEEVLSFAEEAFVKQGENYSVIIFGIAGYANLKESFGLEAAKRVLSTLGRLLKKYSNASDVIAYYGDEEFLACLLGRKREEAIAFIENLDGIVRKSKFMFQQTRIAISLSAQAFHRVEAKDLDSLLKMGVDAFLKNRDTQGIIKNES